jgi:hypothetical protein
LRLQQQDIAVDIDIDLHIHVDLDNNVDDQRDAGGEGRPNDRRLHQ